MRPQTTIGRQPLSGYLSLLSTLLIVSGCTNNSAVSANGKPVEPIARSVVVAESESHTVDGPAAQARFGRPEGLAFDSRGNLYVADTKDHVIRKINQSGYVSTVAGSPGHVGHSDGHAEQARFAIPSGLAIDRSDNIYVADAANETIRKISPGGNVSTFAGSDGRAGFRDGSASEALMDFPEVLAIDASGVLYTITHDAIRRITPHGQVTTIAGRSRLGDPSNVIAFKDGPGLEARFSDPSGLAIAKNTNIFVADGGNLLIRKIDAEKVVTTIAGHLGEEGNTDGDGSVALFSRPSRMAIDSNGDLIVSDCRQGRIRRVAPNGVTSTVGIVGCAAGVAIDKSGSIFLSVGGIQPGMHRPGAIVKLYEDGHITTVAGPEYVVDASSK